MPVSVQITLIISIVVLSCVALFASIVRNQQQIEQQEANAKAAEALLALAKFAKENKETIILEGDED